MMLSTLTEAHGSVEGLPIAGMRIIAAYVCTLDERQTESA